MVIAPAFADSLPSLQLGNGLPVAALDDIGRRELMQAIADRGIDFVAQEAVTLSTMPVWRDGTLAAAAVHPAPVPRQDRRRLAGDARRLRAHRRQRRRARRQPATRRRTADAWVLSDGPVPETTLLPTPERMTIQRATGVLPSRAADNLFWVGRYVERAEATLRLVRALINRVTEADDSATPVIGSISGLLGAWSAAPADSWQRRRRSSRAPR